MKSRKPKPRPKTLIITHEIHGVEPGQLGALRPVLDAAERKLTALKMRESRKP